MKKLLVILVFVVNNLQAQVYVASTERDKDQTKIIQAPFNNSAIKSVSINTTDVVINGIVNIPDRKMLSFEHGFKIKGNGTINGGTLDANYQSQIFDTSIHINPRSVNQCFSVKWFGAKGNNDDDHAAIQKSINTCIKNNIRTVFLPVGRYKISKPLIIPFSFINCVGAAIKSNAELLSCVSLIFPNCLSSRRYCIFLVVPLS